MRYIFFLVICLNLWVYFDAPKANDFAILFSTFFQLVYLHLMILYTFLPRCFQIRLLQMCCMREGGNAIISGKSLIDDWLIGFNAVFTNCSVISRRSVHLLMCFLAFSHHYTTRHTFQATGCFSTLTISPLVKDEWRLSKWLLSNVGMNVGRVATMVHDNGINNHYKCCPDE